MTVKNASEGWISELCPIYQGCRALTFARLSCSKSSRFLRHSQIHIHSRPTQHGENGHWRLSKVIDFGTNWKHICDFLLVFTSVVTYRSYLEPFRRHSELKRQMWPVFLPPLIRRFHSGCSVWKVWKFAVKFTYRAWAILPDRMIVAWVVLTQYQRVTDRRTGGQTDLLWLVQRSV